MSRSRRKKLQNNEKGLVTMNAHVQYESPTSSGKKVMSKVEVFRKKVKLQGHGHEVKNYGKVMAKVKGFVHASNADADVDTRAMTLAPWTFVPPL